MKTLIKHTFFVVLGISISLTVNASVKRGVESGGGGGIAWIGLSHPVLMDYFTIINSIEELPISSDAPSRVEKIESSPFLITNKNEEGIKFTNKAFEKAFNILENWEKMPNVSVSSLLLASFKSPLSWNFTDNKLTAPPFYLASSLLENAHVEVAAYYSKKNITNETNVQISKSLWNQMPLNDQAGLLIHEALRHVQIGFGNDYNDESLQRGTAIYLLCRPTGRLNYYMYYMLNNSPSMADKIYGSFHTFIQSTCRSIQ